MNFLTKEELILLQNNLHNSREIILVKFSAKWCKPCRNIKQTCQEYFSSMPKNIRLFDIDIDEQMDLYIQLKKYKMIKGVPTIMMWAPTYIKEDRPWFVPDDSVSGGDINEVKRFFERCSQKANSLQ